MKKSKQLVYIAVFGALWGVIEVAAGMILHNLHVPFTGLILTIAGIITALVCVKLTNRKSALLSVAIIAAILKMLSFTFIKIGPIVGIITSAFAGQIVLLLLNINLIGFIFTGGVMASMPFVQFLAVYSVIYTPEIFKIYEDVLRTLGFKDINLVVLISTILSLHFLLGSIAGLVSWQLSKTLIKRSKNNEISS